MTKEATRQQRTADAIRKITCTLLLRSTYNDTHIGDIIEDAQMIEDTIQEAAKGLIEAQRERQHD
jgi:hypothetical protein